MIRVYKCDYIVLIVIWNKCMVNEMITTYRCLKWNLVCPRFWVWIPTRVDTTTFLQLKGFNLIIEMLLGFLLCDGRE